MNRGKNISIQLFKVILGLFIGFYVVASTVSVQTTAPVSDSSEQTSNEDQPESTEQAVISQAVPHSSLQINLGFQSYLLEEVFFSETNTETETVVDLVIPRIHQTIDVIIHRIISPNAP